MVYSANVGDSMAYIEHEGNAKKLSFWHHVDNEEEAARVEATGMNIFTGRLGGVLLVTRAFGDYELQKCNLLVTPQVT